MDLYTSLSRLCSAPGPSGHIGATADVAEELLRPLVDEVRRDKLNNLLELRRCGAPGAKLVLLDAHLDEMCIRDRECICRPEEQFPLRLYAIVNSLTELGAIERVSFRLDGMPIEGWEESYAPQHEF